MQTKMKERVKKQLSLRENILYCSHDSKKVCEDCKKKITGDASGITGDVSGIRGNVSGITGDASEIMKVLKGD
jgi:hypothetical protein